MTLRSSATGVSVARRGPRRRSSLARRVLLLNSAVVVIACLALALGPATVSSPVHTRELLVLFAGVAVTLVANLLLVRHAFAPLRRLTSLMRKVDPLAPGARVDVGAATAEVAQLATAFNDMLDRLEDERRESARRALRAQEAERQRLARELHDELGQSLTGVLLLIDEAIRRPQTGGLERAREDARHSLEDIRRIARDLRPDTLVEFGLLSALDALATRFTRQTGVAVERRLDPMPTPLGEDAEVVIYRVAQEALTNVARHADAGRVRLELSHGDDTITLSIDDDGIGIPSHVGHEARGITGMRERALLVRGRLTVRRARHGGTRVTLDIPLR